MDSSRLTIISLLLHFMFINLSIIESAPEKKLFREYIGAEDKNVRFSDVPINPDVDFHFLLSFAIDYTNTSSPSPTNGDFRVYWDSANLSPSQVSAIKAKHSNVKVSMSLAGDTVNGKTTPTLIPPLSTHGSLEKIRESHRLCKFSILCVSKGDECFSVFEYFDTQSSNYYGGKILVSFGTDGSGGLSPENGFFKACGSLSKEGKLHGIFIWSADDSKKANFKYERQSQDFLASQ
ncbi:hypothetical protein DH2020_000008 [Rehmannia glutinosa]|uniref:Uncharacterized protein n=1 Tax=Rehmannia glutinosa TaxID=99300 RepID=A0ABR0W655_REHGL